MSSLAPGCEGWRWYGRLLVGLWILTAGGGLWGTPVAAANVSISRVVVTPTGQLMGFELQFSSSPSLKLWADPWGRLQWISLQVSYATLVVPSDGSLLLKSFQGRGNLLAKWNKMGRLVQVGHIKIRYNKTTRRVEGFQIKQTALPIKFDSNHRIIGVGSTTFTYNTNGTLEQVGELSIGYQEQGLVNALGSVGLSYNPLDWRVLAIGRATLRYRPFNQGVAGVTGWEARATIQIRSCQEVPCPAPASSGLPGSSTR